MTYFDKNFDLEKFLQFLQDYVNDRTYKKIHHIRSFKNFYTPSALAAPPMRRHIPTIRGSYVEEVTVLSSSICDGHKIQKHRVIFCMCAFKCNNNFYN